jgi:hypothetical protein
MTDAELRGRLLTHFYGLRYATGGWVLVDDLILAGTEPIPSDVIEGVCRHLSQLGLIEWQGYAGQGPRIGSARITVNGSSAVEHGSWAGITITFPGRAPAPIPPAPQAIEMSHKVFVVHGHDDAAKNAVAFFLSGIGLDPIILHLRPNGGRDLLTKFTEESEGAGFAVVLMTPDDEGGPIASTERKARALQNVVFELGFFIGRLGPGKVAAVLKGDVEKPSDFNGIAYISLDPNGRWKNDLARELRHAKVPFDADKAFTA